MEIPRGHALPTDRRDDEEFVIVLEGRIKVVAGNIETTLKAGDSMPFKSQSPHSSRNESKSSVTVLHLGTPSVTSEEPRLEQKRKA